MSVYGKNEEIMGDLTSLSLNSVYDSSEYHLVDDWCFRGERDSGRGF